MKLAIITGGSRGLGEELVKRYEQQGFEVVEFSRSGNTRHSNNVDFADPIGACQVIASKLEELGRRQYTEIVAISNAAMLTPIGPLADSRASEWIANLNVSFTSAIVFMGNFVKYFQDHDCRKVMASISSGAALNPYNGWSLYCSGKAGLEHYVRCVAEEQKQQTRPVIAVNVNPGVIDTDMQSAIRATDETRFPQISKFVDYKNKGVLQSPASVAEAISLIVGGPLEAGERYSVV